MPPRPALSAARSKVASPTPSATAERRPAADPAIEHHTPHLATSAEPTSDVPTSVNPTAAGSTSAKLAEGDSCGRAWAEVGERVAERHRRGRKAEDVAAAYLEGSGYQIVGRNVRVRRLELDLIARSGEVIAVVEVRTRGKGSWLGAFTSVDAQKQLRVRRAGVALWKSVYSKDPSLRRMRFDIISVGLDAVSTRVEHLRAAF